MRARTRTECWCVSTVLLDMVRSALRRVDYFSPLSQPLIPSSLTVIGMGSGSWDLYFPVSSK